MLRALLGFLAWLLNRDIEGTALSFVVCQLTLAVAASAATWVAANHVGIVLFLPTVLLAAFFLRFLDGGLVLLTSFIATWYFVVPPSDSFVLNQTGAVELAIFVLASLLIVVGAVSIRKLVKRTQPLHTGMLQPKPDLIAE